MKRDLIVIGGSAGSFQVLKQVISTLPSDLGAAICVVIHTPPSARSELARALGFRSSLPVADAVDGDLLQPGRIYVAPPDRHLLLGNGHMHLTRGPKEGLHRPSINVTFRSAAHSRGMRVIGLLLSGLLDDGASGLWEIARHGGVALIQDPDEAEFPSMPLNALQDAPVHYRLRSANMPSMRQRLVEGEDVPDILLTVTVVHQTSSAGLLAPSAGGRCFAERSHRVFRNSTAA